MRELNLEKLTLKSGARQADGTDMCVMEAVAFISGEEWSDSPTCACPVVAAFLRRVNDRCGGPDRQKLKELIPLLVGSREKSAESARAFYFADVAVREFAVKALRDAGNIDGADKLEGLQEIVDVETAKIAHASTRAYAAVAYAATDAAYAATDAAYAAYAAANAAYSAAYANANAAYSAAYANAYTATYAYTAAHAANVPIERLIEIAKHALALKGTA